MRILNWIIYISILVLMFTLCTKLQDAIASEIEWQGVVIHHTASPDWTTAKDIDRWHKERGFNEIGYHYLIRSDGKVEQGRSINRRGAHALNPRPSRNRTHIGIALVGHDVFTEAQYASLRSLLRELSERFTTLEVTHHHERCPGIGFEWAKITLGDR